MATRAQVLEEITHGFPPEEGDFHTATLCGSDVSRVEKDALLRELRTVDHSDEYIGDDQDPLGYGDDGDDYEPFRPFVDITQAERVAKFLLAHGAQEIHLFGSVARQGLGDDLDLAVTVSEEDATAFVRKVMAKGLWGWYFQAHDRFVAATTVLRIGREDLLTFVWENWVIDIFLFPIGWQDRLEELQTRLPHEDPEFMVKISKDARRFDSETGQFEDVKVV